MRPIPAEYPPYYNGYISKVPEGNLTDLMLSTHRATQEFIASIPEEKGNYRYADGKWTVKEVLLHMVDVERVMAYRALRFGRNDTTTLPGFDENTYAPNSNAAQRTIQDIAAEFAAVRGASFTLFAPFSEEILSRSGHANGQAMSVRSLGYIIVGHELHHLEILKTRYL